MNFKVSDLSRFTYRSGGESDAEVVQLLIERAIAARKQEAIPTRIMKPEYIEENRERLSRQATWSRLIFDGDRLAGLGISEPMVDVASKKITPRKQHITLLMVDPEYWGKGIGGWLLDLADSDFTQRGVQSIELETDISNLRSRTLYERKGYRLTGKQIVQNGNQVHYKKCLEPIL